MVWVGLLPWTNFRKLKYRKSFGFVTLFNWIKKTGVWLLYIKRENEVVFKTLIALKYKRCAAINSKSFSSTVEENSDPLGNELWSQEDRPTRQFYYTTLRLDSSRRSCAARQWHTGYGLRYFSCVHLANYGVGLVKVFSERMVFLSSSWNLFVGFVFLIERIHFQSWIFWLKSVELFSRKSICCKF